MRSTVQLGLVLLMGVLVGCAADDDVCLSTEATPRLKIKFKNYQTEKLRSMDTLEIRAQYNGAWVEVVKKYGKTDSLLVPLEVAASTFTDLEVRTSKKGAYSKLRVGYEMKNIYVSPACGVKKN